MQQVFLSRRNLITLLNKLDRNKSNPGESACTLIKNDDTHKKYPQTMKSIAVTAIEDDEYYDRPAGEVHPLDTPEKW